MERGDCLGAKIAELEGVRRFPTQLRGGNIMQRFRTAGTPIVSMMALFAASLLPATSLAQQNVRYVSVTGGANGVCSSTQPCGDVASALSAGGGDSAGATVQVVCIDGSSNTASSFAPTVSNTTLDIDCPKAFTIGMMLTTASTGTTLRVRHLEFKYNPSIPSGLSVFGSGTVILEDCVFTDQASVPALDIEPNGPLDLVIRNSRISNSSSGILLKPAASGSINATLDHVTIAQSAGGGIKIDTTNGPVTMDVADSVITKNGGNGVNAVGNVGGQAIVSIKDSIVARNGAAGAQANGTNAGVFVANTLFDQNAAGATSVVSGGNMSSYGNNQIVGSIGSGFNRTAPLH
jgi:hypothetical protein